MSIYIVMQMLFRWLKSGGDLVCGLSQETITMIADYAQSYGPAPPFKRLVCECTQCNDDLQKQAILGTRNELGASD